MDDDLLAGDIEGSSDFEDALDESEESNNTDSDQSLGLRQYWQGWRIKEDNEVKMKNVVELPIKEVPKLMELSARIAARSFSFDQLEYYYKQALIRKERIEFENSIKINGFATTSTPNIYDSKDRRAITEAYFLPIIKHSFPEDDSNIRFYSCVANGCAVAFKNGEQSFASNNVFNVVQIGYLITAKVKTTSDEKIGNKYLYMPCESKISDSTDIHHVTICVDRQKIISTSCTCQQSKWCQHVIAACLERLHRPERVQFRTTIWDSITELKRRQVQKLVQYFINALPRQYLPVAQQLIDELKDKDSEINKIAGAPDPTDGGHDDIPIWNFSVEDTHKAISQILIKFVKPSPVVHCDISMLNNEPQPAVSNEYNIRRMVLKSRHPIPLWNGFELVCEMFRRKDENATMMLHMITTHCLSVDQIVIWWYQAKLLESGQWHMQLNPMKNNRSLQQNSFIKLLYDASELCDEVVRLWKIAALNPKLTDYEREQLTNLLQLYHQTAVSKILKALNKPDSQYQMKVMINSKGQYLSPKTATFQKLFFPGFSAALEACQINYQRAELRSFPLSVVKCMPSSTLNDCLNIPLLKTVQDNFIFELEQTSHQVTTAVFFEDQIESSAEGTSNQKSRSKKKRRKRVRMHNQSTSQNQIAKQNPGSNVNFGGEYSGGEDSLGDDFDDACYVTKEKHQLELDEFFAQMHAEREPFQIRLDACDAIAHHGYLAESIYMAMKLADELLKNKPNINYEGDAYCNHLIECTSAMEEGTSQVSVTKKTTGPMFSGVLLVRQIDSCPKKVEVQLPAPEPLKATKLAVETMESALKIMKILLSCPNSKFEFNNKIITQEETNRLLIEIGVAALSMPRKPAATHQLEVYLNYLDTEILDLLRKVKLLAKHLHHLTTVASHLITQCQQPNTPTMPPLMLALFLIESLSKSKNQTKNSDISRTQEQENIALQAAILCLDMKPSYVEEDLPMNFECYRQLKRILTVSLLSQYKDNVFVLGLILDKLLDPGVHRIHENHESNGAYFLEKIPEYKQQYIEGKRPVFKSGNIDLKVNSAGIQLETENEFQTKDLTTNASEPSTSTCGQRKTTKVVSPHATEALALFYYDLATKIYTEAGGPSPSHVFINTAGGFGRPNRNLQMCAFLIGFYAIGVHNLTVRNWSNRAPYVKLVGWLQNQAIEIGQSALEFVEKNWMHHFTAVEVSALADKANHRADQEVITQGAKLALTALKSANFLPANDAENRIRQCKDWGLTLLEQACIAVERVANEKGNIQPQVLFTVSRSWYEIYMEECSREEIIIPPPNLPPRNNQMQYGYFPLRPMNEQCHNPCMMPMYFPPPPISHYVNGPAAGLHPSYSAPNLLPPPQIPYQFRNDYNYYFNHVVQQRPSGPFQNNLPIQNMRKPRPLIALNMQSNNHSQFPSRNYNVSQTWHSPPQSASPYPPVSIGDSRKMRLLHAYRTGMLAMQVQRNQELEDKKLFEKHLCSPPYIEDLARLRKICQQLGYPYLQSFFEHVAACISAPKLLEEYAKAAMEYFAMTHHIHQPIVAYIEQLPLPPPGQLVIIPPKQNLSGVPSSSANCGSTSTAKMLPHQYANIHIDVGKTADSIIVQMHNVGYPEYIVELVRRGVEMSYVAISCQITFGKLTEADAEALRMYLKSARCIFQFIPEGKGLYEIFIRYWKNQKLSKKKISELRIKDLFEEFIDFHVFENHN